MGDVSCFDQDFFSPRRNRRKTWKSVHFSRIFTNNFQIIFNGFISTVFAIRTYPSTTLKVSGTWEFVFSTKHLRYSLAPQDPLSPSDQGRDASSKSLLKQQIDMLLVSPDHMHWVPIFYFPRMAEIQNMVSYFPPADSQKAQCFFLFRETTFIVFFCPRNALWFGLLLVCSPPAPPLAAAPWAVRPRPDCCLWRVGGSLNDGWFFRVTENFHFWICLFRI